MYVCLVCVCVHARACAHTCTYPWMHGCICRHVCLRNIHANTHGSMCVSINAWKTREKELVHISAIWTHAWENSEIQQSIKFPIIICRFCDCMTETAYMHARRYPCVIRWVSRSYLAGQAPCQTRNHCRTPTHSRNCTPTFHGCSFSSYHAVSVPTDTYTKQWSWPFTFLLFKNKQTVW